MNTVWISVVGSVIVGALSLIGVLATSSKATHIMIERLDAQSQLSDERMRTAIAITDTKLESLTLEVRKHNGFAEKIPVIEEKIKVVNKRIDAIQKG